jgi:hypothetical protein
MFIETNRFILLLKSSIGLKEPQIQFGEIK